MPVYHFHVRFPGGVRRDAEGTRLADETAVRREAIDRAIIALAEGVRRDEDRASWRFDVRDERDEPVLDFPFSEAIPTA